MSACVILSLGSNAAEEARNFTFDLAARFGGETENQTINKKEVNSSKKGLIGIEGRLGLTPSPLYFELNGYVDGISGRGTIKGGSMSGNDLDYKDSGARGKLEADAGLRIGNSDISLTPFVGLGVRTWYWGDPDPNFLHIESWTALYGAVGFRVDAKIGETKFFGRCAIQPSFKETVSVEGEHEDLDRNTTIMGDAEIGVVIGRFRLGAFGELFRYKNDKPSAINETVFSEDIKTATFGGTIGINF